MKRKLLLLRLIRPLTKYVIQVASLILKYLPITIISLSESRIGEFAPRTDSFLRQLLSGNSSPISLGLSLPPALEPMPKGLRISIIDSSCNEHLCNIFKRYIHIISSRKLAKLFKINMNGPQRSAVFRNDLKGNSHRLILSTIKDTVIYNQPPVISFTQKEEQQGQKLLRDISIPVGSWFVCFQARDPYYLKTSPTNFRNTSIGNYVKSIKYIKRCGGYTIRVGSDKHLSEPIKVDYTNYDSFGDIYLLAKCKFFVGCESGLRAVPLMFNVPIVETNTILIPIIPPEKSKHEFIALGKRDLFVPKHIYSDTVRLSLKTLMADPLNALNTDLDFNEKNLIAVENTPEEVLSVVMEMNEKLNRTVEYTEHDVLLQEEFKSLAVPIDAHYRSSLCNIGRNYLREEEVRVGSRTQL